MKTNNTTAGETAQATTNALIYKTSKLYIEDGEKYRICVELSLNDECKNGYEDFGFTCDGYRIARNGQAIEQYGGCCHDQIIKHFPGLIDDIVNLHLCDFTGAPMYAVGNTFYFIKEHNRKAVKSNLYVCSEEEIDEAMKMSNKDELYFAAWLEEKHIPERWKEAAQKAIAKLEDLTGKKFESAATRQNHYTPLSEEQKWTLKQRMENGYYTEEAAEQRAADEIDAVIAHNVDYYEQRIKKAQQELDTRKEIYAVLKTMSRNDLKTFKRLEDNFIIYSNPDRICFNWINLHQEVSEEEIKEFETIIMGNDILNSYIVTNKK